MIPDLSSEVYCGFGFFIGISAIAQFMNHEKQRFCTAGKTGFASQTDLMSPGF